METSDLSIFIRAFELGSLTKASEEAGYSASAGSHIIRKLEQSLGVTLLIRDNRGVSLSPEGRELLPYAKKLMAVQASMERAADGLLSEFSGSLCIGSISSVAVNWLPYLISSFNDIYPRVKISVIEGGYDDVEDWIIERRVECGFISSASKRSFDIWSLHDDPLLAVISSDNPLSSQEKIHINQIRKYEVFPPSEGVNYDVGKIIKDYSLKSTQNFESISDYSAILLAKRGLGITIMPELLLSDFDIEGISIRPLDPNFGRTICIASSRSEKRSAIAQKFIDHVIAWADYK